MLFKSWNNFAGKQCLLRTTAPSPKAFLKGMIYLLQGDKVRAQPEFEQRAFGFGKIAA